MRMIEKIKAKARADVKRIVLPEGDEPRTVEAAETIRREGIAEPILIGSDFARTKADEYAAALGSLGQLFAGVHQKWLWKGTDAGSNIEDPYKTVRKRFAHGAPLVYTVAPALGYNGRFVGFSGELTLGDSKAADIRVSFMW